MEISSLLLFSSPVLLQHPNPLLCVSFSFQFLDNFSVFLNFLFVGWGITLPGGYAGLSQGRLEEY
jgi:hypothetical protein